MAGRVKKEIVNGDWARYYRNYQKRLASEYLIPILLEWGVTLQGRRLLEIGCGDGGCGAAFYRAGCQVVLSDIEERLIDLARKANREEGIEAKVFAGDVYDPSNPIYEEGPYDIVLFRDVMEHLDRPQHVLRLMEPHLTPGGVIFIVFPPYYSPYGAHQQILPRRTFGPVPYNKLPFIQLLPDVCFNAVVSGEGPANDEVRRLRGIRLTLRKFRRAVAEAGYVVRAKRMFLSRPSFALRYGIPTIPAPVVGSIPILNELLVTAAYYLVEPGKRSAK